MLCSSGRHLMSCGQSARQFRVPENPVTLALVLRADAFEGETHEATLEGLTDC